MIWQPDLAYIHGARTKGPTMEKHALQMLDLKKVNEDGEFEGYASIFGETDEGNDVVEKGAYKRTLKGKSAVQRIKMLFQHDPSQPLGQWLDLHEDDKGLYVKGKLLTKVQRAAEVLEMMRAGILDGLSIGFRTVKAKYDDTTGVRRLLDVDLWEISIVTFPLLKTAKVTSVKGDWTVRDVERVLREAGMDNAFAKLVASHGYDQAKSRLSANGREADAGLQQLLASMQRATNLMKEKSA